MKQGKSAKRKRQGSSSRRSSLSPSRLERMISETIVDCYNDSEQAMGFFNMIEEKLLLPFTTTVLGIQVTVEKIDLNEAGEIVAVCARGPERQRIPIYRRQTRLSTPLIEDTVRLSSFRCRRPRRIARHCQSSPLCSLALVATAI